MHLNDKNAPGIENILIIFIKMSAETISFVLSEISNKCIQNGLFPSSLKVAKITPLHKGGNAFKRTNYRPISIWTLFSKIFQKIIYYRLNKYFETHNYSKRSLNNTNSVIQNLKMVWWLRNPISIYKFHVLDWLPLTS